MPSTPLATVSLASAIVGTTGTVSWESCAIVPRPGQPAGHIVIFNESGCLLQVLLSNSQAGFRMPAGAWRKIALSSSDILLTFTVLAILPNQPISVLAVDYYPPGMPVDDTGTLGNSPIGLSGAISAMATSVINDGNAPPTRVIEATPSDQVASSLSINNDGTGFIEILSANNLRKILNAVRGDTGVTHAIVDLGDTNDRSMTTFHGLLERLSADAAAITSDGNGDLSIAPAANNTVALGITVPSAPGSLQAYFRILVLGDTGGRIILALRSDGYGELRFGTGTGAVTSLYGQSAAIHSDAKVVVDAGGLGVTAGATSLDGGNLTTDGTNGTLTRVGGQASVGGLGVPVIVARAVDVSVTVTTQTTILSYTPTVQGHFRVSAVVTYNGSGGSAALSLLLTFQSPYIGATNFFMAGMPFSGSNTPELMGGVFSWVATKTYPMLPAVIEAAANQPITVKYTSPLATPADHVSVLIERID